MKKILLVLGLVMGLAAFSAAENLVSAPVLNPSQAVVTSSVTIFNISISSYAMTRIDIPKMTGGTFVEVQNNDSSSDACCSFDISATTATTSQSGKSCRVVNKLGGTWSVARWYRDLSLYCQTLSTTASAKIVVVQAK